MKNQEFTFNPGPIFTNLLLADEINRAPAKLLEAMQERQVTVDGVTYPLELPFITSQRRIRWNRKEPIRFPKRSSTDS